jgi:hypothetical protein
MKFDCNDQKECNIMIVKHLAPKQSIEICFRVKKILIPFEDYPNDGERGIDLVPLIGFASNTYFLSSSELAAIPIPDFTMPFNANGMATMVMLYPFITTGLLN